LLKIPVSPFQKESYAFTIVFSKASTGVKGAIYGEQTCLACPERSRGKHSRKSRTIFAMAEGMVLG
jgi:hypothetical protein